MCRNRRIRIAILDIHEDESRSLPDFVQEGTVAFDALDIEAHVASLSGEHRQRKAQRIGSLRIDPLGVIVEKLLRGRLLVGGNRIGIATIDEQKRIDDVAFRLRHLETRFVANECMEIDVFERRLAHEMNAEHHHAGDPEEDDIGPRFHDARRIKLFERFCLIGPTERRKRP